MPVRKDMKINEINNHSLRGCKSQMIWWASFLSPVRAILSPYSQQTLYFWWDLQNPLLPHHTITWWSGSSCNNRLCSRRTIVHRRICNTLIPLRSYPWLCRFLPVCSRCRGERRRSSSMHHSKDKQVHMLRSSAIGQCTSLYCRQRRNTSNTGSTS